MNDKKLALLKEALLRQRAEILKDADKTVEQDLDIKAADLPDSVDRSSVETDRSFTLRLRDRERKLLKKVDEALARLEDKEFGDCEECGGKIGYARLKARPVTTMCIDCKEEQERREKKGA